MAMHRISVDHIQNVSYMSNKREVVVLMHDGDDSYDLTLSIAETGRLVDQLANALDLAKEGET